MANRYYVASCGFTWRHRELSRRVWKYMDRRWNIPVLRCCVPGFQVENYEKKVLPPCQEDWKELVHSAQFQPGDVVYYICHNCANILEESKPGVEVRSIWELILTDDNFPYPDHGGKTVTVQDCWRSRERREEQEAVRELLRRMKLQVVELEENFAKTDFCGSSLYRPQVARNPKLAPRHYDIEAAGKFLPHTPEEQKTLMEEYCKRITTEWTVCYCHTCLEGLEEGEVLGKHLAELLFPV